MLRVRNECGRSLLTFKGPVQPGPMKLREEHETVAADGDTLLHILEELGLRVWFRYEKYREEFSAEDVVIAIDETPVGTFVEIEGGEEHIHATAGGARQNAGRLHHWIPTARCSCSIAPRTACRAATWCSLRIG